MVNFGLFCWNFQTLTLDWSRFPPIREEIHRVTVLAAMVASVHEYSRSILVSSHENATISAVNANVNSLDKNQATLLKNFKFLSKLRDELNLLITREEVADDRLVNIILYFYMCVVNGTFAEDFKIALYKF